MIDLDPNQVGFAARVDKIAFSVQIGRSEKVQNFSLGPLDQSQKRRPRIPSVYSGMSYKHRTGGGLGNEEDHVGPLESHRMQFVDLSGNVIVRNRRYYVV